MPATISGSLIPRYRMELERAWAFLDKISYEHPLWLRTLTKGYRLTVLAEGGSEAAADTYAAERMANWHNWERELRRTERTGQ